MNKEKIRYVVVIQCDKARNRCSGFACSNSFFERQFAFSGYEAGTKYVTMTCGGCCGSGVAGLLEHFGKKLMKKTDIGKDEVAVHLSSCIVTDNHHHDRCPNVDYIKDIIQKKGYHNIIEGTYQSQGAKMKREKGEYKSYSTTVFD